MFNKLSKYFTPRGRGQPFADVLAFIREQYPDQQDIPLHVPLLGGLEKSALADCIDTTFVSSIGPSIAKFEDAIAELTGTRFAIALVNGTAALELAMRVAGVNPGDEVITQSLTFIATANAISHCGAEPIFVDVDNETLGLSPTALRRWLEQNTQQVDKCCVNKNSGRKVAACICMHTFGHPVHLREINQVCEEFNLPLIEDAAEALGSRYGGRPVGSQSLCGIFSFNGNKIITTGGGGALVTNDETLAQRARHLATTAKVSHPWHSAHDEVGYNMRMPALNAALGCAQIQRFAPLLAAKHQLAQAYRDFFSESTLGWVEQPVHCESNFWLNAVMCANQKERDLLLQTAADNKIHMRPTWQPLSESEVYKHCQRGELDCTLDIAKRLVNLPSSISGSRYEQ